MNFQLPNINEITPAGRLNQLIRFLIQHIQELNYAFGQLEKEQVEAWPVGSVCIRADDTDPGTLLGGVWQRMGTQDGVSLWQRTQ